MCFFSAIYGEIPDCRLLILANREEVRSRPTAAPRRNSPDQTGRAWLGGVDLQAGGTWLGVNDCGLVAAVTNRRKLHPGGHLRSRGLLCRDMLSCASVADALTELDRQRQQFSFDGFNLLLLSLEEAVVVESAEVFRQQALSPGVHMVTNGPLNDPADPRIQGAAAELGPLVKQSRPIDEWLQTAQNLCAAGGDAERPPICLSGGPWGTVSSTILALDRDAARVHYLYAPGPPDRTAYDDYSPQLRRLLSR